MRWTTALVAVVAVVPASAEAEDIVITAAIRRRSRIVEASRGETVREARCQAQAPARIHGYLAKLPSIMWCEETHSQNSQRNGAVARGKASTVRRYGRLARNSHTSRRARRTGPK